MKKYFCAVFLVCSVFVLFISSECYAKKSCVTSKCHAGIKKYKYLHGPVGAMQCDICHQASKKDIQKHMSRPKSFVDFKVPTGDKSVCLMCHDGKWSGKNIHEPVANGDCTGCHNPHGGVNRFFIPTKKEADTCFECHENNKTVKKFLHGPVGAGECTACHTPHASDYKFQLKTAADKICYKCHSDKLHWNDYPVKHRPFVKSCTLCHDAHNSDVKNHLKAKSEKELCLKCHAKIKKHEKIVKEIKNSKYKHKPVAMGECGKCHNPHATKYGSLLKADEKNICFQCHKKIGDRIKSCKYIHGPVKSDGCAACHEVHGADNPFILVKYFPKKFYNNYSKGMYDLCFECHDEKKISEPKNKDTNFRNGDENLHYLHVRIPGKGRSCKACHEVHASNQPVQVRKGVPFGSGGWMLPIHFTKTKVGGSCVVACHKPKKYNRNKFYKNP